MGGRYGSIQQMVNYFELNPKLFCKVKIEFLPGEPYAHYSPVKKGDTCLAMLIAAVSWLTMNLIEIDFPVIWPIILYVQAILVAFIQALVFPLLIAIFIKVAKAD